MSTIHQQPDAVVHPDEPIQMVDLHGQYLRIQTETDAAMQAVLERCAFINGPQVHSFAQALGSFLDAPYVIPCGNGTDALQLALMALPLKPGDEVIIPAFTYIAAAEVIGLLSLRPVLADVNPDSFNLDVTRLEELMSPRTRAIIAVHLFGQLCDMEPLMNFANRHNLYVIEDNAQSIGATYTFSNGLRKQGGTIGHIGTTSFFPTKPLACYGDGGAVITSDKELAVRIRMLANHGQQTKYNHQLIGCNSRLDTLQAAILEVRLKHLETFNAVRQEAAVCYDVALTGKETWRIPHQSSFSSHVYHQYTLQVADGRRDALQAFLQEKGIPSMIYYPLPLHHQPAYRELCRRPLSLPVTESLCRSVLSLPIHTEIHKHLPYIVNTLLAWTKQ